MSTKALVLLSGGQDSTTCLYWAIEKFDTIEAIGFDYGQKHIKENKLGADIAAKANVNYYLATINTLCDVSPNALTNSEINVEKPDNTDTPPNTLVEGRNLLFLVYAAIYAKTRNIDNIVIGVGQTDYSGYPDCRNEFIVSANQTINLATDYKFNLHTPLMWKTKAETWLLADQLKVIDVIKNETLTCYNGVIGDGCGTCPSCILRENGWQAYLKLKKL